MKMLPCRCRLVYIVCLCVFFSLAHLLMGIKYPMFTYRADVEDRWRLSESSYYKTKSVALQRSILVNGSDALAPLCPLWPPGLGQRHESVNVRGNPPSLESIIGQNPSVHLGGLSLPENCTAQQKVAVIITYKDRWNHLLHLLSHLHPLLRKQQCYYRIYVAEQVTGAVFNKGRMYNTGFLVAMSDEQWDCIILHDVDLIPETNDNIYRCADTPLHLSAGVDSLRYTLMYKELVGGVLAMTPEHYHKTNGFSNSFWGWGGEDDDMELRIQYAGLSVLHTSTQNGRYKMVPHTPRKPSGDRYMFLHNEETWKTDGLSSMTFLDSRVIAVQKQALYTNISIEAGTAPHKNR